MPKKTQLHPTVKLYYLFLAFALLSQVVTTVFKLSQTISYQHRISALQTQKQQLAKQQEEIQFRIGELNSLSVGQANMQNEYLPISAIFVIPTDAPLALKL